MNLNDSVGGLSGHIQLKGEINTRFMVNLRAKNGTGVFSAQAAGREVMPFFQATHKGAEWEVLEIKATQTNFGTVHIQLSGILISMNRFFGSASKNSSVPHRGFNSKTKK